jgi:hypothetical protein
VHGERGAGCWDVVVVINGRMRGEEAEAAEGEVAGLDTPRTQVGVEVQAVQAWPRMFRSKPAAVRST